MAVPEADGVLVFKPQRPGSVWVLMVCGWLVGGWFIYSVRQSARGHFSVAESNWYTSTMVTGGAIIVALLFFVAGMGWARVVVGLLYVLDALWPVVWRLAWKDRYMSDTAQVVPFCFGIGVVVLMFVVPTVRAWLRDLRRWRASATEG